MSLKKWLILSFALVLGVTAFAEEWLTNCEKACSKAKKENKLVLVVITGSDWCPPCKKLHSEVLTKPAFKKYAREHLVTVSLDFPRKKKLPAAQVQYNQQTVKKLNAGQGVPTSIVLDPAGRELGRIVGYSASYLDKIKNIVSAAKK